MNNCSFSRSAGTRMFTSLASTVFACLLAVASPVQAQTFPTKPLTIVVGFPPGGSSDTVARVLGAELAEELKQPVVVDNRPGASQVVAGTLVARAAPDGYTLFLIKLPNVIPPSLQKKLPYGGNTGFDAISPIVAVGPVLVASTKMAAKDMKELVRVLKANPDKYMFGGAGVASSQHIWGEQFNAAAGTKSQYVPFKGVNDVVTQLVNGELDWAFVNLGALQFAASGKMNAIGVASPSRDPDYPAVPTLDEQGLNGFQAATSLFLVAPKGTPLEVRSTLNQAVAKVASRNSFYAKLRALGGVQKVKQLTPSQTQDLMAQESDKIESLVKAKNITLE